MTEHADRLTMIARWLQREDDPLLYSPDGLAADDIRPPGAHGSITLQIVADASCFVAGLATVRGAVDALSQALAAACQSAVALREAMPDDMEPEEEEPMEAIPWGPMPRGGPLYEAWADWAAGATAPELEACRAAGIPYPALWTAQELRAQREEACDE